MRRRRAATRMTRAAKGRQGGCFCGRIRFRVMGRPIAASACHCRDCQRFSGGPFLPGATFRTDQVTFISGELRVLDYGDGRHRAFCEHCGSHLTFRRDDQPGLLEVFTVHLDDPEAFRPKQHTWYRRRLSWVRLADALPRHATEPEDEGSSSQC